MKVEEITAFERKDFEDEDGTVVYRSYIKITTLGYAVVRNF